MKTPEWVAAIILVVDQDGHVRPCNDFEILVNPATVLETYLSLRMEELFARLPGGEMCVPAGQRPWKRGKLKASWTKDPSPSLSHNKDVYSLSLSSPDICNAAGHSQVPDLPSLTSEPSCPVAVHEKPCQPGAMEPGESLWHVPTTTPSRRSIRVRRPVLHYSP